MTREELYAQTVHCGPCNQDIGKYRMPRHRRSPKHLLSERASILERETVSEETFRMMLLQVLMAVEPETIVEMQERMHARSKELYMPSKTAVRSKRWRDNKRYLGNPYRVEVGQVWRRIHKTESEAHLLEVIEVGTTHARVTSGLRTTRVRLDRFRPQYQGYERMNKNQTKESK